jgi:hypothetical protein
MCTVLLPAGGYPIAVNKYINNLRERGREREREIFLYIHIYIYFFCPVPPHVLLTFVVCPLAVA